ncbi:hypothetical protein JL720_4567 [Aureococcus anophagefferens]|nr:hypothetical protein JL720_4567 [Aureococcus anophagefferens]
MASALSAGQQLSALIAGTSIEQLRAQWSLTAARALVRNAPPESKLRTDPHAIDRVPEGGKLRAEDFLVLMATATNAPRGDLEMAWAAGAVDLFRQMDLRGEGELDWNDFAAFVLGLDMPKREREEVEDADEPGREHEEERSAEARSSARGCASDQGVELVHIITPDHPPRVSGALRHHTAYRPHKVLACGGVVGTSIVVTGSSIAPGGPHYVSLWSLPSRSGGAREGPLLPVLVHRRETPSPMSAITYSARLDRLYTGGETSGLVYEWSFDENRKSASADATGPKALGRCRTLRLHTFGVTTIVELERRKRHSNLIVTGSTDGNINVWNPSDWFGGGAADDATFDSAALGEDHSSAAVPAPHGRKELVPVLQLAAQSTGPGTIVVSVDHGLLFSAGRLSLTRHSAQISDVVEVVDEAQLVTADIGGLVVVWQMPQLTARQQVTLPSGDLPNVRVCISPLPHYGYASSNPARDIAAKVKSGQLSKGNAGGPDAVLVAANTRLALYQFQLSLIKEPLLLAHYDAGMAVFVVVSAQRVSVWDANSGRLRSQIAAANLIGDEDAAAQAGPEGGQAQEHVKLATLSRKRKGARELSVNMPGEAETVVEAADSSPPEIVAAKVAVAGRKLVVGDDRGGVHVCVVPPGGHAPRRTKSLDPTSRPGGASDGTIAVHDEGDARGYCPPNDDGTVLQRSVRLRDVKIMGSIRKAADEHRADGSRPATAHLTFNRGDLLKRRNTLDGGREVKVNADYARKHAAGRGDSDSESESDSDDSYDGSGSPGSKGSPPGGIAGAAAVAKAATKKTVSVPEAPPRSESVLESTATETHEILCATADLHLNLIASVSRNGSSPTPQLCVWDFELFILLGTCLPPVSVRDSMAILAAQKKAAAANESGIVDDRAGAVERVTAIGFLTPFPVLCGLTSTGVAHLWRVPECGILHTLDYRDEPPPQAVPWYHKDYVAPDKKANAFVTAHVVALETPSTTGPRTRRRRRRRAFVTDDAASASSSHGRIDAVVGGGTDGGGVVTWALRSSFFARLNLRRVRPSRRRTYNPGRQVHTTVNWSELRRSRRLSQVDLGGRSSLANVAGASDRDSWDLAVFQAHDDVEVTSLQIIEKPRTILTASEDGLARIWTWNGVLVGQLDVNRPAGGDGPRKVPWDFVVQSTSAKTEVRGVQETLSAAKVAAAAFASVPRSARRRASAPNLSRATTPASEHSSRPTTALSPEEGWDAVRARTSTFHGRVRSDKKPEDHSWDAIFDGIASLEKNAELKRSQSLPRAASSQNRRPQTGKWWQTRDSMAPIAFLAPELSELSSSFSTVDPPHKRDKRAQTAAARLRAKPRPLAEVIATKRRPIPRLYSRSRPRTTAGFADNDPNPLARLTRLAHMGL